MTESVATFITLWLEQVTGEGHVARTAAKLGRVQHFNFVIIVTLNAVDVAAISIFLQ